MSYYIKTESREEDGEMKHYHKIMEKGYSTINSELTSQEIEELTIFLVKYLGWDKSRGWD